MEQTLMKTSELRLGNFVNVPRADQSPFRIDEFDFLTKKSCKVGMNVATYRLPGFDMDMPGHPLTWELADLSPIPLTKEWLEKFGFTNSVADIFEISILREDKKLCIELSGKTWLTNTNGDFFLSPAIYVHTLQNLYYSLTTTDF